MKTKLNALVTDGKVWIKKADKEAFIALLNKKGIEYFSFTSGNEVMIELNIEE